MRLAAFANRTGKEILRDPLNLGFGLGFPLILLLLLQVIQRNIPVDMFRLEHLTPGIAVFGLSFMTLFSATLLARDRETSLLQRLYTTPLTAVEFILGYALPVLPIAMGQCVICYAAAMLLGLTPTVGIAVAILLILPVAWLFLAVGLLCGSLLNTKQVGGICGALFTNLSAWLSGIWFDLKLLGGPVEKVANCLPFVHAVELGRAALAGSYAELLPHLLWVTGYAVAISAAAVFLFLRQMKR